MQGHRPFSADLEEFDGAFDRVDARDHVPTIPFKRGFVEEKDGVGFYAKEWFGEMSNDMASNDQDAKQPRFIEMSDSHEGNE